MAERQGSHVGGGLDCSSRARRSDERNSSNGTGGNSHGCFIVAPRGTTSTPAAAAAESGASNSTDPETEALISPVASSIDLNESRPHDEFSAPSSPSSDESPPGDESPPSPQFAVSDTAQPWSRTGGAMALDAARLIQQVGIQQLMRRRQSPRQASAPEQLPDPQPSTWAYSRPVVILDAFWNLAFVVVTAITLFISQARHEHPPAPLSIWLLGYAVQCAVHVICVLLEHERRESRRRGDGGGYAERTGGQRERGGEEDLNVRRRDAGRVVTVDEAASVLITGGVVLSEREAGEDEALLLGEERAGEEDGGRDARARGVGGVGGMGGDEGMMVVGDGGEEEEETDDSDQSLARRIESANTMFSFAWWLVGFTWILSTIDDSFKDAPILSWATTAFLAFDVFFVVFCVAVACVVGMAVCCCLPCIIALIYAVADQEGASREQIEALPKFKFYRQRTAANNLLWQASSACPFHSCSSSFRPSSSPSLSSSTSFSSTPAIRTPSCPCCSSSAFAGAMWRNAVGLAAGLWRRAGRAGGNNNSRNTASGDGPDVRVTVEEETGGIMSLVGSVHPPRQRHVEAEDAECCVCLVRYEDGCVLRELPCAHHFHAACIDKWLKSHPTCPLCKRDITKGVGSAAAPDRQLSSLSAGASEERTGESTL
ncbi:hypothetical protein CLOM_g5039 [Closterium sp. NIES-68]|nr:hypothetical protein CLOM_g5039 [Closterium sp. NIES-68]GJP67779.1 hypothetical protein CLOP_g24550 [Closterium sp. NIES-67]